jgi:hypothetical protein
MTRTKWATVALSLWLGFVALIVTAGSCSIDKKSDEFTTCERQGDCSNGESCINGVCLAPDDLPDANGPDGNDMIDGGSTCPSQCTSCRVQNGRRECIVDCMVSGPLCNAPIVCPPGFHCDIRCSTESSCQKGITCGEQQDCTVNCTGRQSCINVNCGSGECRVTCVGEQSCRDNDCGESCACDVICQGLAPRCEAIQCTAPQCIGGGTSLRGCSSEPQGCNTCQ